MFLTERLDDGSRRRLTIGDQTCVSASAAVPDVLISAEEHQVKPFSSDGPPVLLH